MKPLEQLKKQYKILGEEIEKLKNTEIDFSKWIGRLDSVLAIKWEKLLKSYNYWDIQYSNDCYHNYTETLTYTHTTLDKLEKWDVFICEDYLDNIRLIDFCILIWQDNTETYILNYLKKTNWIEYIADTYAYDNHKVIKFNRY